MNWTATREQQRLDAELERPLLRWLGMLLGVMVLNIGLLLWTFFRGDFHRWHSVILIGGFLATQALVVSWFIYIQNRRARMARG